MPPVPFKPLISTCRLLTPRAAKALSDWFGTSPVSPDGRPVIALFEDLRVLPRETFSSRAGALLLNSDECQVDRHLLWPMVAGEDPECLDCVPMEDVLSDGFAHYRDAHFEISHVRLGAMIRTCGMKLLTSQGGRNAGVLHTATASVYIDQEPEPAELVYELRRADPDPRAAEGLVHVHPHRALNSNHERLAFTQGLGHLNRVIAAGWRSAKNSGTTITEPLSPSDIAVG